MQDLRRVLRRVEGDTTRPGLTVLERSGYGMIHTMEHYGDVSPDFVDLTIERVSAGDFEKGRRHKLHAHNGRMSSSGTG